MGGLEAHPKNHQKWHRINKISTLTSPNNSLQNAMKVEIFLMYSLFDFSVNEGSTL